MAICAVRIDVLPVELVPLDLDDELVRAVPLVASTADERASTTTAMPTRMTAGMTVQMISSRVFPWICGPSASSLGRAPAPEADDEEDERGLDEDEDDRADGEDEPVELVDRLAARRAGIGRSDARRCRGSGPARQVAAPSASTARAAAMTAGVLLRMGRCDSIRLAGSRASPRTSPVRGSCNSPEMWFSEWQRDPLSGKRARDRHRRKLGEVFARRGERSLGGTLFPKTPSWQGAVAESARPSPLGLRACRTNPGSSAPCRGDRAVRGLRQRRAPGAGVDFSVLNGTLRFVSRSRARAGSGILRWASMFFGVAGTYRKNDSVDVVYEAGGKRVVASGLPIIPPGGPEPPPSS